MSKVLEIRAGKQRMNKMKSQNKLKTVTCQKRMNTMKCQNNRAKKITCKRSKTY